MYRYYPPNGSETLRLLIEQLRERQRAAVYAQNRDEADGRYGSREYADHRSSAIDRQPVAQARFEHRRTGS